MIPLLKYFLFLLWLGGVLICGMLLFTRGFLLNREVLHFQSSCKSLSSLGFCDIMYNSTSKNGINGEQILECTEENVLSKQLNTKIDSSQYCFTNNIKVILLLIDALRYDFVQYESGLTDKEIPPYKNKLTVIHELSKYSNHGRLFKFIADPPTTTMQRLNGLTTGSLPTFIDIGSNFDTSEINEDNLIDQLVQAKKNITFMGDESLTFMYPGRFKREFPYPSFDVWDLDTVDTNVKAKLVPEIRNKDWDLVVAHFLGVDHCGHRYGPHHPEMKRKLIEMDEIIRDVVAEMDNNTMLFVIGDHGMTGTGEHGGESEEEVTSAMFVYSKRPLVASVRPMAEALQVDLVPTLAAILGVPIPFSNLGHVLVDALPSFGPRLDLASNWEYVVTALWTNVKQVTLYIQEYAETKDQFPPEKLAAIIGEFHKLRSRVQAVGDEGELLAFVRESEAFVRGVREMCAHVWARFDSSAMSRGLVLHFLLLALAFILIEGIPVDLLDTIINSVFVSVAYASPIAAAVTLLGLRSFGVVGEIEQLLYFTVCSSAVVFLTVIVVVNWPTISDHWYERSRTTSAAAIGCRLITVLSVVGVFSNSFVINEASVAGFLLASLVAVSALEVDGEAPKKAGVAAAARAFAHSLRGKAVALAALLFLLLRFSLSFVNCRPEQGCEVTQPLLSDSARCLSTIVFVAVFITAVRLFLRGRGNLVGFSPTVFVSRYAPTAVVIATGGYWVLYSLPRNTQYKLFEPWQLQILPRTAMSVALLSLACLFVRPLSIYHVRRQDGLVPCDNLIPALFNQLKEVMVRRTGSEVKGYPVVFGLATAYSACFLNLSVLLTLLAVLLLGSQQAAAAVLLAAALWLLAVLAAIARRDNGDAYVVPWWNVVAWGLSAVHFFYATGHQASFTAIDWKSAFLLSSTASLTSYAVPGTLVVANVFCAHALHSTLLPLLLVVPHTLAALSSRLAASTDDARRGELALFEQDARVYRAMFKLCLQYALFFGLRTFGCMLSAAIHARHLMVWSVFAPKLIFEGIGFIVSLPCLLLGFLLLHRLTVRLDSLVRDIQR